MQQEQHDAEISVDAQTIAQYLSANPEFFDQHSEVLSKLKIPHHTGDAISLIEKQVSVLRRKCYSLENKLGELIQVATENEKLQQRLHLLTQDIVSASCLDDIVSLTRESLIDNFHADNVRLFLIDDGKETAAKDDRRYINADDENLKLFEQHFASLETWCGTPPEEIANFLFDESEEVGSIALIPLHYSRDLGMAILSSRDEYRFESGKGVIFLNQLGEVLSRRLCTFLQG